MHGRADLLALAERRLAARARSAPAARTERWNSPLTLRELEVARLVAQGRTNREIAGELRISVRTAGSHLERISAKLGTSCRSEIAAWVTSLDRST